MKKLILREVRYDDKDLLYRWANDPIVRSNSFNTNQFSYDSHIAWFNKMMSDPTVLQYILMNGEMPVGQIRLNIVGEEAEIGYSISAEHRGKGYGHKILQLIANLIEREHPDIKRIVAKVKPDNAVSNKLFQDEDYLTRFICYEKQINHGSRE